MELIIPNLDDGNATSWTNGPLTINGRVPKLTTHIRSATAIATTASPSNEPRLYANGNGHAPLDISVTNESTDAYANAATNVSATTIAVIVVINEHDGHVSSSEFHAASSIHDAQ